MPKGRDRGESLPRRSVQSDDVESDRLRYQKLNSKGHKKEVSGPSSCYSDDDDDEEYYLRGKRIPLARGGGKQNSSTRKKADGEKPAASNRNTSNDDSPSDKGLSRNSLSGRHRPPLWRRHSSRKRTSTRKKPPVQTSAPAQKKASAKNSSSTRKIRFSRKVCPSSAQKGSIDLSSSSEQESTSSKVFSGKGVDGRDMQDSKAVTEGPAKDDTSIENNPPQQSQPQPPTTQSGIQGTPALPGTRGPATKKETDEIKRTRKITKIKYKGKDLETSGSLIADGSESTALVPRSFKSLLSTSRAPQQQQAQQQPQQQQVQQQHVTATPKHDDCEAGLLQRILHALSGPAPILSSPFPRSISQALSPRPLPELLYRRHETTEDDNARQPGSSFLGARKILRKSCRYKRTSRPAVRDKSKRIRLRTKADLVRVISRSPSPKAQSEPPRENRRKLLRMMRESQAVYEASQSASTEERRKEVQRKASEYQKHRPALPLHQDRSDDTGDSHGVDSGAPQVAKEKKRPTHAPRKHD